MRETTIAWCAAVACAVLSGAANAQLLSVAYRIGAVRVTENVYTLSVDVPAVPVVRRLADGRTWPRMALDENGDLFVGNGIVDARRAVLSRSAGAAVDGMALPYGYRVDVDRRGFLVAGGGMACLFTQRHFGLNAGKTNLRAVQDGDLLFNASEREVLALAARLGDGADDTTYAAVAMDLATCRVTRTVIGNPGRLVELGYSRRGGWWVTSATTGVLLRSRDGRRWTPLRLPAGLASLDSSYVVDNDEIWLARGAGGNVDAPALMRSTDGGAHWSVVRRDDAALAALPAGWLEGRRRVARLPGARLAER